MIGPLRIARQNYKHKMRTLKNLIKRAKEREEKPDLVNKRIQAAQERRLKRGKKYNQQKS